MPAYPHRLSQVSDTRLRLQLTITYHQLVRAGVIRRPLPARTWERLVRDVSPPDRVRTVLALLKAQRQHHEFRPALSDEIVALAIHEASPAQVNEFVFLVDWTPAISVAIRGARGGSGELSPKLADLKWSDTTYDGREESVAVDSGQILTGTRMVGWAELVDAFQSLRAYGIIDDPLPLELLASAFIYLLDRGDTHSFNRLVELAPEEVLDHPVVAMALDEALESKVLRGQTGGIAPAITAPYTAIPPSKRWRRISAA